MLAAHDQLAIRVARSHREGVRGMADHLHHEIFVHADIGAIHLATGFFQDANSLGVQKLDPDVFQNPHGAAMDRLHPVSVQRFRRAIRVNRNAPRHLVDDGSASAHLVACTATGAAAFGACVIAHRDLHRQMAGMTAVTGKMDESRGQRALHYRRKSVVFGGTPSQPWFKPSIHPASPVISASTTSACGARSARVAIPVSTATAFMPAARPASRSCLLSPTIAVRAGSSPCAATKAKSCPGAGLPPAPARCARAGPSLSLVARPSVIPRAFSPPSTARRSTAGTIGASAESVVMKSVRLCRLCPCTCGRITAEISGTVWAITGLSGEKSPVTVSTPNTRPSARALASSVVSTASRLRVHAPQLARKSNSVPSLSKIIASSMGSPSGSFVQVQAPPPRPGGGALACMGAV